MFFNDAANFSESVIYSAPANWGDEGLCKLFETGIRFSQTDLCHFPQGIRNVFQSYLLFYILDICDLPGRGIYRTFDICCLAIHRPLDVLSHFL